MTTTTPASGAIGAVCGEHVPALRLDPGDTIRVRHVHHPAGGPCLVPSRPLDVEVTDVDSTTHQEFVIVAWHGCARLLGSCPEVCGVSVYRRCEAVLRIGHAGPSWLEGWQRWHAGQVPA
jgi:hypothetical protein